MMFLMYLVIGMVAGTLAGLLGVGGGVVIVPALLWVFAWQGVEASVQTHMAVGTSLATIVFTSLSAIRTHHQVGAVDWPLVGKLTLGIVLGAGLGAWIADNLEGRWLQFLFGAFEVVIACQMLLALRPAPHRDLPGPLGLGVAGTVIGTVSSLFGIGGGSLTVPYLSWCNVPMQRTVATSASCGFPIAVAGAASFMVAGWGEQGLPPGATGYLYWPAFAGIVLASMVFAHWGALLAHRIPALRLKRIFAVFVLIVGVRLMWSAQVW